MTIAGCVKDLCRDVIRRLDIIGSDNAKQALTASERLGPVRTYVGRWPQSGQLGSRCNFSSMKLAASPSNTSNRSFNGVP